MAKRGKNENSAVDKHKVFVRNIRENDVGTLDEEFKKLCIKYFFFKNKNNSTKSAICCFRSDQEAENFIEKYNDKKIHSSNIKCEFAFKKKYNEKKLMSIIYRRHKINHLNAIKIYTNYDIDNIVVLSFLKNIFLLNRQHLVNILDEHVKEEKKLSKRKVAESGNKDGKNVLENIQNIENINNGIESVQNEDYNIKSAKNSDYSNAGYIKHNNQNEEDGIEIVVEKKHKEFEEIVVNIEKGYKRIDNKIKEKLITEMNSMSNRYKLENEKFFIYTVEFLNLNLAARFYSYINKNNFENYLKENIQNVKKDIQFHHQLCYLNKDNRRVIIKNIKRTCHIENIQKLFKHIETNPLIYIPKKNNKKMGYALVTFSTYENLKKALLLNKSKLCGSIITIDEDRNIRLMNKLGIQVEEAEEARWAEETGEMRDAHMGNLDNDDDDEETHAGTDSERENKRENKRENERDNVRDLESEGEADEDHEKGSDCNETALTKKRNHNDHPNDIDEGKTLFITNVPLGSTEEEIENYVVTNISKNFIYIKTCQNNSKKISVFVKLKVKKDADNFLKKIGEYDGGEEEEDENGEEENVIDKFYNLKKKKKRERMKQILLKDHNKGQNSELLFFKNNYLMIKRAVSKETIKNKKKFLIEEEKKKIKSKNKMHNNIHLIQDNDINNDHLSENIIKRNNNLMEKKKKLLKNKNFLINPCRIYVRNYPAALEQNTFRQLITKHFTPIFMKKENLKKKEAFKKANEIIKKMKIMKDHTDQKEPTQNEAKNKKEKDKKNNNTNGKNIICFIDINKHEHAKQIICLLQNRNIYELINEIIYKKKFQTIRKNKNIMYVDYCIEDIRMIHIKKLKEEKFLNHIKEKNIATTTITKKTIKKKKKESRGKRQREKRRLLKMQNENTNIAHVIKTISASHSTCTNISVGNNKGSNANGTYEPDKNIRTKEKSKLIKKNGKQNANSKKKSRNKQKEMAETEEKRKNIKNTTSKKLIKKAEKKCGSKKKTEIVIE
ncbi:RNA-binding protein [Plasmodium gonderi]|uniref:RNA-binding protein n=1 Tax=Plasmodium gonderi TaxID=77519 RepID=A0A1Y1JNZ5_PLAGO|nr:RNA-binding protein [Plasmodium gonderi]GAW83155.1 RNA-binding protein [Plasmodium gonderi]